MAKQEKKMQELDLGGCHAGDIQKKNEDAVDKAKGRRAFLVKAGVR